MQFAKRHASDAEKTRQWVSEHEFTGLEFDWLAVDRHGQVAVFSAAGYGPVPVEAIDHAAELDAALDEAMDLPVIGAAENRAAAAGGDYSHWHAYSARGFYAYDWNIYGPYQRLSTPSIAVSIGQLSAEIQAAARIAEFDVDFADEAEIIWYQYADPFPS